MKPIIKVENLGKQYQLGEVRKPYLTLRESLVESVKSPFKKSRNVRDENEFWALKDVSFEIQPGEVVGIIGKNGAGKSTLLKILSRITEPTKGRAELYGRIASLLEVGTGFHPELTGRENIFLNGAILGMRREEISKKFDEIVDFADVDKFIETPVKRYSSGMYVRLAFAVAAHLEPEILVIDEVLSVGDAEFQKKCLGKMKDVAEGGRTVLFVSHNMVAVQSLCSRGISLNKGEIWQIGEIGQVISNYMSKEATNQHKQEWEDIDQAPGNSLIKVKSIKLIPQFSDGTDVIDVRTALDIYFEFWNLEENLEINLSFALYNLKGECIMNLTTFSKRLKVGLAKGKLNIPGNFLNDDSYYLTVMVVKDQSVCIFRIDEAISFTVEDYRENTAWFGKWAGSVRPTFFPFVLEQNFCE